MELILFQKWHAENSSKTTRRMQLVENNSPNATRRKQLVEIKGRKTRRKELAECNFKSAYKAHKICHLLVLKKEKSLL